MALRNMTRLLEITEASMANLGGKYSEAGTITPDSGYVFTAIQIVAGAVITCVGNVTGITSKTFDVGTVIYGLYTSITVTSGAIIAYNGIGE